MSDETSGSSLYRRMPRSSSRVAPWLEQRVHLVDRRGALDLDGQVDERAGRHRDANREPVELAGERRQDEAERLRGAGRGRHDVGRRGARTAGILVRAVDERLVGGVRVHGGHQSVPDAERLVQHLGDGCEAVGRARRVGDDVVGVGVVVCSKLTPSATVMSGSFAGAETMTFVAPARRCFCGVRARAEPPARLDHDVHVELAPRQCGRISLHRRPNVYAVDEDASLDSLHGTPERPVDRVVLEQPGEGGRVDDVVDGDPLDVGAGLDRRAERGASRSPEAVDGDADGHGAPSWSGGPTVDRSPSAGIGSSRPGACGFSARHRRRPGRRSFPCRTAANSRWRPRSDRAAFDSER